MRWIYLIVAMLGFALAYTSKSPGLVWLGFGVGFIGLVVAFLAMAAARIADRARPDAALLTDADINALRTSVQKNRQAKAAAQAARPLPAPRDNA